MAFTLATSPPSRTNSSTTGSTHVRTSSTCCSTGQWAQRAQRARARARARARRVMAMSGMPIGEGTEQPLDLAPFAIGPPRAPPHVLVPLELLRRLDRAQPTPHPARPRARTCTRPDMQAVATIEGHDCLDRVELAVPCRQDELFIHR